MQPTAQAVGQSVYDKAAEGRKKSLPVCEVFFRPYRASLDPCLPTAYAVGCILSAAPRLGRLSKMHVLPDV
jgi:hypothetical protein